METPKIKWSHAQTRSCPFCSIVCNNKHALHTHMEQVHGSKQQFKCHICGKSLARAENLRHHIATHTGQQSHQCNICGKKIASKAYYIAHMNKHAGTKLFQCKLCLKSFTYSQDLSKHKRNCTATSPFC